MTKILDGKKLSKKILNNLKKEIERKKLKLKLAIVLVGEDLDSKIFIEQKRKACELIGINFELFQFPEQIRQIELAEKIKEIIKSDISGLVIQLPLPQCINTDEILSLVPKEKDAEFISPVVCAISCLLEEYKISLINKKIVLIGKGRLVGQPVGDWLKKQNLVFSGVEDIKQADLVISGAGRANLIKGDMIKKGAVVIDVGRDVDFKTVSKKASYFTPTPGGVGPMTVACLLKNLVYGFISI
jgi:methylenetetrahydrofolate dehydrogenase (NADP+)/methenyltetrahydrofolate cyclohydrolase